MTTIKINDLKDAIQGEINKCDKILEAYVATWENLRSESCFKEATDMLKDINEIEGERYGYTQILKLIDRIVKKGK